MSSQPPTGSDSNASSILSDRAFEFLLSMGFAKAAGTISRMIASRNVQKNQRAFEILAQKRDPRLTLDVCASSPAVARKMGLSEVEWKILKRIRRADSVFKPRGIEIKGYLDLSGISGPCSIPISKVDHLNMAYSSALTLPKLRTVSGEILILVGTSGIRIPNLEKVAGEVSACRASDLYLPALDSIGWDLDLHEAEKVDLPNLRYVGHNLSVQDSKDISVPRLVEVTGSLNIRRSQGLRASSLQKVGLLLHANKIDSILPSLVMIGRRRHISRYISEAGNPQDVLEGFDQHHVKKRVDLPHFLGTLRPFGVLTDRRAKRLASPLI